jgi:hypothetical protein
LDLKDQLAQLADLVEMVSREDLALKEKLELLVSRVDLAEMDNPVLQAGNLDQLDPKDLLVPLASMALPEKGAPFLWRARSSRQRRTTRRTRFPR